MKKKIPFFLNHLYENPYLSVKQIFHSCCLDGVPLLTLMLSNATAVLFHGTGNIKLKHAMHLGRY